MIDRLFTSLLTFCLLIGASVAIGSMWTESTTTRLVTQLPAVEVVAKRWVPPVNVATNQPSEATRSVQ
jgi:hypothetical protein